jgi:carbonic anhydrase
LEGIILKFTTRLTAAAAAMLCAGAACAADAAHWSYEGKTAPDHWGDLDPANRACSLSKEQSPIDIVDSKAARAKLPALDFGYHAGAATVENNGHTVQVSLPPGSTLKVGGQDNSLLQFHFHTPSEEKINGVAYPMVAHFVHKGADGKLSVVAVLFKEGAANATLAPVLGALPAPGKPLKLATFDPAALLPADRAYYKFAGSLTTPPCSDGVRWQVLKQPMELSPQQIAAFRALYPMNARPVQPLNGRLVEVSE